MTSAASDLARRQRLPIAFFSGTLLVLLVLGRTSLLHDPGSFWHTAVGNRILTTGTLPVVDEYTHTFGGKPWIAHQWLGECLMALVHRLAGFDGLVLAVSVTLAGMFCGIAVRLLRIGLHPLVTGLLLALVFAASAYSFHARPHIATMVLLGVMFGMLCDVERGTLSLRRLWLLVPLFALWTNLHGGALGGLCTLALVAAGWGVLHLIGWESPVRDVRSPAQQGRFVGVSTSGSDSLSERRLAPGPCRALLAAILVACGLSTLVNPYGAEIPRTWWAILDADLPQLIVEHAPLNPSQPEGQMTLLCGATYLLILAGIERRPRVTWVIPLVWLALAITRIRHAPLFAITAAIAISDILPHTRWRRWLERRGYLSDSTAASPSRTSWLGPSLIAGALLIAVIVARRTTSSGQDVWARPDPQVWPAEVLPELQSYAQDYPGAKLFNEMHFGGFLIASTPRLRTFIDDRCELFGDAFLFEYVRAESAPEVIDAWIGRFGIEAALTRPASPFDHYFAESSRWRVVAGSPTATFYVLSEHEPANNAELSE